MVEKFGKKIKTDVDLENKNELKRLIPLIGIIVVVGILSLVAYFAFYVPREKEIQEKSLDYNEILFSNSVYKEDIYLQNNLYSLPDEADNILTNYSKDIVIYELGVNNDSLLRLLNHFGLGSDDKHKKYDRWENSKYTVAYNSTTRGIIFSPKVIHKINAEDSTISNEEEYIRYILNKVLGLDDTLFNFEKNGFTYKAKIQIKNEKITTSTDLDNVIYFQFGEEHNLIFFSITPYYLKGDYAAKKISYNKITDLLSDKNIYKEIITIDVKQVIPDVKVIGEKIPLGTSKLSTDNVNIVDLKIVNKLYSNNYIIPSLKLTTEVFNEKENLIFIPLVDPQFTRVMYQ